jgi:transposase
MFWGAFCGSNRTSLTPLLGDPNSARGGVTARRILQCLQENLPTIAEPGLVFMQDNAPTHKAHIVQNWLISWAPEHGLELMDWPPYSPDLNPIENLWSIVKRAIFTHHPELSGMPKNNTSKQRLCEAAVEAWEDIREEVLDHLCQSMRRRLEAVIAANGWYTKY